jgi:hypothetical protein
MVIAGNLSFNFVDSNKFKAYVSYLQPDTNTPNRKKLCSPLDEYYKRAEKSLLPGLGYSTKISLALDGWSSTNQYSF